MLSKLSIRQKLIVALGSVLLLLTCLSIYDYFEIKKMSQQTHALLDVEVKIEKDLTAWRTAIEKNIIRTRVLSLTDDPSIIKNLSDNMALTSGDVNILQTSLEKSIYNEKSKALYKEVLEIRKTYNTSREEFLRDKKEGRIQNLEAEFNSKVQNNVDLYMAKVNELLNAEMRTTLDSQNSIIENLESFQSSLIIMTSLAILIGIVMCIIITNSIVKPIQEAISFANKIADGDLNNHLENDSKDEVGVLVRSLQKMNQNLKTIVTDVRNSAGELFTSSSEISAGNNDLSQRTESVAASLEEAAASVEQFTQTLTHTSENSAQANKMTNEAYQNAQVTAKDMSNFQVTMGEINKSSNQIGDIISVIESIAFQTNILALNAAVEAARAGDQGRGFSVVASEVRSLSKRSSDAAKEIKELIKSSQEKVKSGTQAVEITSKNIESLTKHINNINDIVSEINNANKEQSLGIKQINEVIAHIDDSTQKNAALVEESTAATESMRNRTQHLNQLVNKFNV